MMDRFVTCKRRKLQKDDEVEGSNGSRNQSVGTSEENKHVNVRPNPDSAVLKPVKWRQYTAENLDCKYTVLYSRSEADNLILECEKSLSYFTGQMAQVQVFGKWHDIPRKQAAYGDDGLTYRYSGNTIAATPWTPLLENIRDRVSKATGWTFNFVLINRYKDGRDHMGEHRDDERELQPKHPIASLSLGQPRDFVFKHAQSRGKNATRKIAPVTINLEHGSLLMMNYPTNTYWYHSLPQRKSLLGLRINMTFRKIDPSKMTPVT
ncbi:DNA oxidative demethylase ALKBH2-like [Ylistrum balloti]|uniref:DNA oxidative demethylase ALKBH2-like n=1 Tax=Ylistrum balloti TaxID=509963 RepID=UPI002905A068|nr:DNA oxidative demethylase ALKBH2-like [Ylistrum balloti]